MTPTAPNPAALQQHYTPADDQKTRAEDRKLPVIEVFGPTIQGEGAMIGVKTMFVRMGGCDFRCKMCDSLHAVIPEAVKANATRMSQEDIGQVLWNAKHDTGVEWVTISGGNPAMWDLSYLIRICHTMNMKVAVETQATVWHDWIAECDQITLSPKAPGMGERFEPDVFGEFLSKLPRGRRLYTDTPALLDRTCLKVVVFSQLDMDHALMVGDFFTMAGGSKDQLYLSLGNDFPPALLPDMSLDQSNGHTGDINLSLPEQLMARYRVHLEDFLQDPRFVHWKFLPQLHTLVWANKTGV